MAGERRKRKPYKRNEAQKAQQREYQRQRRLDTSVREREREQGRAYYAANKAKRCAAVRRCYQNRREAELKMLRERRKHLQAIAMAELGGSCMVCGEDCPVILEFHHRDPSQKTVAISTLIARSPSVEVLMDEVHKCILLCRNCHGIYHWAREDDGVERLDLIRNIVEGT